jgi:predicted nucleotidyltransferase
LLDSLRVRDGRYLEDLREYLDEVLKVEGVVLVVVFGSLSRGLAKPYPESDIDILVVARDLPGELAKRRSHTRGVRRRPLAVEDLWLTPEELLEGIRGGWGVILDAIADGIPLHDPENLYKAASEAIASRYRRIGKVWDLRPRSPS